jgi:putative ABC transport system permease protein
VLGVALSSAALLSVVVASRASISAFSEAVAGLDAFELRSWSGEFRPEQAAEWLQSNGAQFDIRPFLDAETTIGGRKVAVLGADIAGIESGDLDRTVFVPQGLKRTLGPEQQPTAPLTLDIDGVRVEFARVVHISEPPELADSRSLILDIATLQRIVGRPGMVRWLSLSPRQEGSQPVSTGLPQGFAISSAAERRSEAENLLEAFRLNILVMVAMTLAVAALSILNTLQLHVLGAGSELSTLRTLGVSRGGIFFLVLAEAAVLGVLGGAIGSTAGRPIATIIAKLFLDTAGALYFGGQELSTQSLLDSPYLTAAAFVTAVAVSVGGALLPAWQASKSAPALGTKRGLTMLPMRAAPLVFWSGGAVIVAIVAASLALHFGNVGLAHLASVAVLTATVTSAALLLAGVSRLTRYALHNSPDAAALFGAALVDSHRRAAALAVMVSAAGCALLLGMGLMIGSFRANLQGWIEYTVQADLFIRVADDVRGLQSRQLASDLPARLRAIPGVSAVTSFARIPTKVRGQTIELGGTELGLLMERGVYRLLAGSCTRSMLESGAAAMVSEVAARKLRLSPGQIVDVLGSDVLVCGVYQDFAAQSGALLVEHDTFKRVVGAYPMFSLGVYLAPTAPGATVVQAVRTVATKDALVLDNRALREQILATFDRTFSITFVVRLLLFLMCLGGAAIGIAQLLWERSAELETFRLLGASSGQVGQSVGWLGAELALSALLAGLAGGGALSWLLLKVINPVSFGWSLSFAPRWIDFYPPIAALLIGVPAVALLAAVGLRRKMQGAASSSD